MSDTEDDSNGADDGEVAEDSADVAEDGADVAEDGADVADDADVANDADAGSADDFDKEAEREKLREQYEHDQKRREATQHMSDLLLKGATMTNAHCDDCGSPIFRYDGEAFCPTCAGTREVSDDAAAGADDATAGADDSTVASGERTEGSVQPGPGDVGRSDDDGHEVQPGTTRTDLPPDAGVESPDVAASSGPGEGDGAASAGGDAGADEELDLEAARSRLDDRTASRSPDVGGTSDSRSEAPQPTERRSDRPRTSDSPVRQGEVPSMAQSRASLRRAIVSLSEQAAQSDDPGRAHNLLKGAREAAEALAALEGTTGE